MSGFDKEKFARHVRQHREASNLGLRAASEAAGVSASTLSRVENEKGMPDADTMIKLCVWMGRSVEYYANTAAGFDPFSEYVRSDVLDIIWDDPVFDKQDKETLTKVFVACFDALRGKYDCS